MKPDFDAIKKTTDIVRVIERYGVALKSQGKDYVGLCPFHEDRNRPNLRVTPGKGLFRCMSCGATGNVIQFVAKKENLTDKEAALKLNGSIPGVQRGTALVPVPALPPVPAVEAAALLKRVATFYAKALHKDPAGLAYLQSRRLDHPAMLETFQVGYCNGTLRQALPKSGDVVAQLQALGILNARGNEVLYGRVVVPVLDGAGNVVSFYGRKLTEEIPKHLYSGPHRGVFNSAGVLAHKTVLITEAIFDAMSLWASGFHHVIALFGKDGWTPHHEALLRDVTTVYLCLDNDDESRKATKRLQEKLRSLVQAVHVVTWPDGVKDANAFFLSRSAADFEALLQAATPQQTTAPVSAETERLGKEVIEPRGDGFAASYGPRRYEVCAVERPHTGRLKATIKAVDAAGGFHIDTVDFYLSRARKTFIAEAARLLKETVETVEADVNRLIVQLESRSMQPQVVAEPLMTPAEQAEAMRMGRSSDLVAEILRDCDRLGVVGETTNKLVGYLVMTSRKMDDPLALHILSGSGAGKSHLQDTILSLCPEEDLIKLTSLSDQALFYKGEDSLRHKVLAVEEEAGANGAGYAIRNLISSKKLTNEATVKNPLTGRLETQVNTVHGPTAVFETTTNPRTNAETKSRFLLTSIDESAEQTAAILEAQRNSHTLEGQLRKKRRAEIVAKHWAFQRLLRPLMVVNPFEPLLRYGEDRLLLRRDNPKYLHLILVVTFLHQFQRVTRHHPELGDYLETTLDDIAIANDLATELFGQSLDELSRPSRTLLEMLQQYVAKKAAAQKIEPEEIEFNRRELREAFGWSEYQMRTHLAELATLEYIAASGGRQGLLYHYRLVYQGEDKGRFVAGLKSVEQLRQEAARIGLVVGELRGSKSHFEGTSLNGKHEVTSPAVPEVKNGHGHGNKLTSRASGGEHIYVLRSGHARAGGGR